MYVVWFCEYLRDAEESGAKVFETIEEAIKYINDGNWGPKGLYSFKLFKLGKEIPLEANEEEKVTQKVESKWVYKVKGVAR